MMSVEKALKYLVHNIKKLILEKMQQDNKM